MVLLIAEGKYQFHVLAETDQKARRLLRRAWGQHCRAGGLAVPPIEDALTVNVIDPFKPGVVYRDYRAMPR